MDQFIVNIIHRPELLPEYIDRSAQAGLAEEVSNSQVIGESLDIFRLQQEIAHRHGLRTTIQMTYASLFNAEAIAPWIARWLCHHWRGIILQLGRLQFSLGKFGGRLNAYPSTRLPIS